MYTPDSSLVWQRLDLGSPWKSIFLSSKWVNTEEVGPKKYWLPGPFPCGLCIRIVLQMHIQWTDVVLFTGGSIRLGLKWSLGYNDDNEFFITHKKLGPTGSSESRQNPVRMTRFWQALAFRPPVVALSAYTSACISFPKNFQKGLCYKGGLTPCVNLIRAR